MEIALARQRASFMGAPLILVAYGGHQMGGMNSRSTLYNILNARFRHSRIQRAASLPDRIGRPGGRLDTDQSLRAGSAHEVFDC
jgi:hypothetical protein